jgi:exodeoxyribonuclease-3
MKIISYNVNGIRAALNKGFEQWLLDGQYDMVCIQETKAEKEQVDTSVFERLGYHQYWFSAEKKGYSGVLILSKKEADNVVIGCGIPAYDKEGRVIRADFGDLTVVNCYFPSGTSGDERQDVKINFLNDIFDFMQALKKERKNIILLGDYNIAHTEKDIHDPKGNKNSTGFLPEERAWMTKWFGSGFSDAFRQANPDKVEYSWWSYRSGARANNKGWRIDYQSVTEDLVAKIQNACHLGDAMHSDHCPVFVEYDWNL